MNIPKFPMLGKIDQIAWYAHNEDQVEQIKEFLGLENANWVEDQVIGEVCLMRNGEVLGYGNSSGHLRFNYDLGIEVEILTYISGPNWHDNREEYVTGKPFLSHVGVHMDQSFQSSDDANRAALSGINFQRIGGANENTVCQRMITLAHTNEYVNSKQRKYLYEIHNTRAFMGVDMKYIYRIQP